MFDKYVIMIVFNYCLFLYKEFHKETTTEVIFASWTRVINAASCPVSPMDTLSS